MTFGPLTPFEREIMQTFNQYLNRYLEVAESMGEAARHGENPQFADLIQFRSDATREASPEEIAQVMTAMVPSVIATVKHFLGESSA